MSKKRSKKNITKTRAVESEPPHPHIPPTCVPYPTIHIPATHPSRTWVFHALIHHRLISCVRCGGVAVWRVACGVAGCAGFGSSGQLGQGSNASIGDLPDTMGDNLPPIDLGTGRTAVAVSGGGTHTCAGYILRSICIICWTHVLSLHTRTHPYVSARARLVSWFICHSIREYGV